MVIYVLIQIKVLIRWKLEFNEFDYEETYRPDLVHLYRMPSQDYLRHCTSKTQLCEQMKDTISLFDTSHATFGAAA